MRHRDAARRLPLGAEVLPSGVDFRVWAPAHHRVDVILEAPEPATIALSAEAGGYFSGFVEGARTGARYKYRLDERGSFPDPASRFQPDGPHGPSEVIDPGAFRWTDAGRRGAGIDHQVIYEMHIGTFTREGTFQSALAELPALARLGVTTLEVMPVAEFPGAFGWGYDGVQLFAPTHLYGRPDDFRKFVDTAHSLGLAVILDVVYNHLGPDGNYLPQFSPHYFSARHTTDWGPAINFDAEGSAGVREFCIANAAYWITEFHLDGLRLDATQDIHDDSEEHILRAIAREVRLRAAPRAAMVIAENEPQQVRLIRPPDQGGYGLDGLWNDDFHHSAMVALTGRREAYYTDYLGTPQEFVSMAKYGFLYQGQRYEWQKKRRGTPTLEVRPGAFVNFTQNHDQVANSAQGARCHFLTSPGRFRAMTALLLLLPATPLLFQGQEFGASSPFLFFADHHSELAATVRAGRAEFLAQFPSLATSGVAHWLADPADPATFERCKLDHGERERHAGIYALHQDLLWLRREDPVFSGRARTGMDGAVLAPESFLLRYFGSAGSDRLLIVNFGRDIDRAPAPEPLLAPPEGHRWAILWSSEDPRYGGSGTPALHPEETWKLPGHAALVLEPERET